MNKDKQDNAETEFGGCSLIVVGYAAFAVYILITDYSGAACANCLIALGAMAVLGAYIDRKEKSDERDQRSSHHGLVYIIKSGKYYKIGMTRGNLDTRLKSIQTGSPYKIEIIHTIKTASPEKLEAELHRQFKGKRLSGEWFDLNQFDIWNIKSKH